MPIKKIFNNYSFCKVEGIPQIFFKNINLHRFVSDKLTLQIDIYKLGTFLDQRNVVTFAKGISG